MFTTLEVNFPELCENHKDLLKKLHPPERPECPEQFRPGVGLIAEEMKKIYC